MIGILKLTEQVTFSYLDQNLIKVKDDYEGAFKPPVPGQPHSGAVGNMPTDGQPTNMQAAPNGGLNVQIAATHAGIITRNNGFYLPERMKKGADTFTKDFNKPVLLHHQEETKDPIGRVIDAIYVDTSGVIQDRYRGLEVKNSTGKYVATINDALIQDFTDGGMPFGQQIDVVRNVLHDSLLEDKGYSGLGFIKILANIADPEAIQKLIDGRYLTGSVGVSTNRAVCSICKAEWTKEGPCDHKPGGVYDDVKCFLITGDLSYDEYSFVNVPADRHSRVLQLDYNGNTIEVKVADDYKGRIYEVQLGFPQYDSTNKEESGMKDDDAKVAGKETDISIKDTATSAPEAEPQTEGAQSVADSVTQTTKSSESTEDASKTTDSSKTAEVDKTTVQDDASDKSSKDFVAHIVDSAEALSVEDEKQFYKEIWSEVQQAFKDGDFTLEQLGKEKLEDAKLSSEKRKKLAKSQFCGPNKSFPVPDCAHVTAARRLIGRYRGPGSKDSILACVSRKAKAMGCEVKKKDKLQDIVQTQDNLGHSRMLRMVLQVLDEDTYYTDKPVLDDEEKKMLQTIIKRMATSVGKDSFQKALYTEELAHNETVLLDEVVRLEEQVGEFRDRLDASQKEYHLLFQDMEELQDSLVTERASVRQTKEARLTDLIALRDHKVEDQNFIEFSDGDLDSEIVRTLENLDMGKITDKLGDGMSRTPEGEVDDPSGVQDSNTQKGKVSIEDIKKIHETWTYLRFAKGQQVAEQYLLDMKVRGHLPQGLEDIKGVSS